MESFGNAKTVRNDNSSRFGKLVLLLIGDSPLEIKGAIMTNYLLEKSRIVKLGPGERNYHIFYHILKGADDELLKNLKLQRDMKKYNYLTSDCYEVSTINDVELYNEILASFKTMQITLDEQMAIFRITAAVLILGNVDFDEKNTELNDESPCEIINEDLLKNVSELLCNFFINVLLS